MPSEQLCTVIFLKQSSLANMKEGQDGCDSVGRHCTHQVTKVAVWRFREVWEEGVSDAVWRSIKEYHTDAFNRCNMGNRPSEAGIKDVVNSDGFVIAAGSKTRHFNRQIHPNGPEIQEWTDLSSWKYYQVFKLPLDIS